MRWGDMTWHDMIWHDNMTFVYPHIDINGLSTKPYKIQISPQNITQWIQLVRESLLKYFYYSDVIMTTMASPITSLMVVYSTTYADQRKHQSSASLVFVWGIHRDRWIPRTKGQLRRKCFHLMTSSCTENCILTASLCAAIWKYLSPEKIVMYNPDCARFDFKTCFGWIILYWRIPCYWLWANHFMSDNTCVQLLLFLL